MWKRLLEDARGWLAAWKDAEAGALAAAIAFYGALSIVPLMWFVLAGLGWFFEFAAQGQNARSEVLAITSRQFSPEFSEALDTVLASLQASALSKGPIAIAGFILGASMVFHQIDQAFARIWKTKDHHASGPWLKKARSFLLSRLRALALLLGLVVLVVVVFIGGLVLRAVSEAADRFLPHVDFLSSAGAVAIGLTINMLVFTALYRFLSKRRVTWRACGISAGLAAVCWEIGSRVLVNISFGAKYDAYGIVGSLLVVQLWVYFNSLVLLGGAVLVKVLTVHQRAVAIDSATSRKSG
ncbi:YihY/virulence factor BrkB family protein [Haloferula sargassicola]|uniref:YihY/virulence factor BrkB family protein n=1 Tax=Haloferula sargassicola TaxID=490096 RepID=A0ABP9UPY5_9BACT